MVLSVSELNVSVTHIPMYSLRLLPTDNKYVSMNSQSNQYTDNQAHEHSLNFYFATDVRLQA